MGTNFDIYNHGTLKFENNMPKWETYQNLMRKSQVFIGVGGKRLIVVLEL